MRQALIGFLVFFPSPGAEPAPPGVVDAWPVTADGVKLHAFHAHVDDAAPTVLWSHGNAGNISMRLPVLLALRDLGLNVLAYDYRGYGASTPVKPSEEGVYADASAALAWLRGRGVPSSRIVLLGESLGGAVSIQLASREAVAGVAVNSTFTRLQDAGRVHYGPVAWLAGDAFDSATRARALRVPMLVFHGTQDELIPIEQGRALAEAGRATFIPVPGAGHNDVLGRTEVLREIAQFARAVAR